MRLRHAVPCLLTLISCVFPQITALEFPGTSDANRSFRRTVQDGLPAPYPLTVVWQAWVLQKSPTWYQTCWFYGARNFWSNTDKYYGCCPYPYPSPPPSGPVRWEIASNGGDWCGDLIEAGRWYTCAFTCWKDASGTHHRFYYDVPNTGKLVSDDQGTGYFSSVPSDEEICWGDAQWDHVRADPPELGGKEELKGRMRRFKIITARLSVSDLMLEAQSDTLATSAARSNIWYLNANPTPDDIQDKSGKDNHFTWYDPAHKAGLWTSPMAPEKHARTLSVPALRAWPNPFRNVTAVRFEGPARTAATVSIFNAAGREIRSFQWGSATAALEWDGTDKNHRKVATGIYIIRAMIGKKACTARLLFER